MICHIIKMDKQSIVHPHMKYFSVNKRNKYIYNGCFKCMVLSEGSQTEKIIFSLILLHDIPKKAKL